jgi:hypothetical protein
LREKNVVELPAHETHGSADIGMLTFRNGRPGSHRNSIFHGILQGKATSLAHSLMPSHLALGATLGLVAAVTSSLLIWEAAKRIPLASLLLLEKHRNVGK